MILTRGPHQAPGYRGPYPLQIDCRLINGRPISITSGPRPSDLIRPNDIRVLGRIVVNVDKPIPDPDPVKSCRE